MAMSGNTFGVIFSGKIVEGASADQVKQNVAKLFKVEVANIERLFTGKPVVLKKGLNEETARKYQQALRKAGAICAVADAAKSKGSAAAQQAPTSRPAVASPVKAPTAPKPVKGAKVAARAATSSESAGLTKYVVKEAPQTLGELGNAAVDEPGVVIVQHQDVPPPQIDTSELSMDQPGVTLSEHEVVAEPAVDISGISMAEPGSDIGVASKQETLEVNVSGLTMDEPGVVIVEHKEVPKPDIDTSKLSVE